MNIYKNTDIAKKYNVSVDTVANWITGSLESRNKLELFLTNNRAYILNTSTNHALLEQFSSKSRKFRNKKYLKKVFPTQQFYQMYSENQIMDLMSILESHREIDMKFIYFEEGAKYWDDLYNRSQGESGFSIPRNTDEILNISKEILRTLINPFEKIDIIDLGVGNGKHIIKLLQFLEKENLLNEYIGLDYSTDMIKIAKSNIKNALPFFNSDRYDQMDFTFDSINKYLFQKNNMQIGKFVFFIGSTIENLRDFYFALRMIKKSLNKQDILIIGNTLKNSMSKMLLNFNHNIKSSDAHRDGYWIVLDRLGIDENYYEPLMYYDDESDTRYAKARLKYDLEIIFKTNNIDRTLKLSRNDEIVVFRHKHHTIQEINKILDLEGFRVLHSITSSDYGNLITICNTLIE